MTCRSEGLRPGDHGDAGGVEYRIRAGRKQARRVGEEDAVIEIRTPHGVWVRPRHELLLWLTKFMYENEDILYPPEQNPRWRGGMKIMDALDETVGITLAAGTRRLQAEIRTARAGEAA